MPPSGFTPDEWWTKAVAVICNRHSLPSHSFQPLGPGVEWGHWKEGPAPPPPLLHSYSAFVASPPPCTLCHTDQPNQGCPEQRDLFGFFFFH